MSIKQGLLTLFRESYDNPAFNTTASRKSGTAGFYNVVEAERRPAQGLNGSVKYGQPDYGQTGDFPRYLTVTGLQIPHKCLNLKF